MSSRVNTPIFRGLLLLMVGCGGCSPPVGEIDARVHDGGSHDTPPALDSAVDTGGDAQDASGDVTDVNADATVAALPTLDDLPHCDREQPNFACIKQLFRPLLGPSWPFAASNVNSALLAPGYAVAPGWKLTVLHGIEASSPFPVRCFFPTFEFATDNIGLQKPGCGTFLFVGGHSHTRDCQQLGTPLASCVDQVPFDEAFDVGLLQEPLAVDQLKVSASAHSAGSEVFLVGFPGFPWLTEAQQDALRNNYPLVSYGHVVMSAGNGFVIENLAFGGSSGSPVLTPSGIAVGIAYTKVGHLRTAGTATPDALRDDYAVAVRITPAMEQAIIDAHP